MHTICALITQCVVSVVSNTPLLCVHGNVPPWDTRAYLLHATCAQWAGTFFTHMAITLNPKASIGDTRKRAFMMLCS